jgi:hypothetical protein
VRPVLERDDGKWRPPGGVATPGSSRSAGRSTRSTTPPGTRERRAPAVCHQRRGRVQLGLDAVCGTGHLPGASTPPVFHVQSEPRNPPPPAVRPPLERQRRHTPVLVSRHPAVTQALNGRRLREPRTASAGGTGSCDTLSSLRVPPWASAAPTWGVETRRRLIGGYVDDAATDCARKDELGCTQRWQTSVVVRYPRRDQDPRLNSAILSVPTATVRCLPAVRRLTARLRVARVQAPPHPRLR